MLRKYKTKHLNDVGEEVYIMSHFTIFIKFNFSKLSTDMTREENGGGKMIMCGI